MLNVSYLTLHLNLLHTEMDHNECSNEYWKENLGKLEVNRSFEQIDQITAAPKRFYCTKALLSHILGDRLPQCFAASSQFCQAKHRRLWMILQRAFVCPFGLEH